MIEKNEIIRQKLAAAQSSPLATYRNLTVGDASFGYFLRYELIKRQLGKVFSLPFNLVLLEQFYGKHQPSAIHLPSNCSALAQKRALVPHASAPDVFVVPSVTPQWAKTTVWAVPVEVSSPLRYAVSSSTLVAALFAMAGAPSGP